MDSKYHKKEQEILKALDKWSSFPWLYHEWKGAGKFSTDVMRAELLAELKDIKSGKQKDDYALRKLDTWVYYSLDKRTPETTKQPTRRSSRSKPAPDSAWNGSKANEQQEADRKHFKAKQSGPNRFKSESNLIDLQVKPEKDKKPRRLRWGRKSKKKYADTVSLYTFEEMMAKKDQEEARSTSDLEKAANKYGTLPRNKLKAFFSKPNRFKGSDRGQSSDDQLDGGSPKKNKKGDLAKGKVNSTFSSSALPGKRRGDLFEVERSFFQMSFDSNNSSSSNQRPTSSYQPRSTYIMRETSLHNEPVYLSGSPRDSLRGRSDPRKITTIQSDKKGGVKGHPIFYLPNTKKTELGEI